MASKEDIASLVAQYNEGVALVLEALHDITADELDRRSGDEWSARMVVHHLADSETNSYVRLRRLLGEPAGTTLQGYDEARWGETLELGYETRPIDASLTLFVAVRAASAATLEDLTPEDFDRSGVHTESGPYSLFDWLNIYVAHARDHAEQILRARKGT
jgi:hypothetical protein